MLVQLQVLNYIISHRDFSIVINNNLDASFFSNFSAEFKFLYEHYKQYGQTPDIETFLKAFPDFEVLQVNESTDYLLSELYKEKNQTFLVTTFNQVKDLLMSGNTSIPLNFYKIK